METNVVDTTSGTIIIDDPSGAFAAALAEATGDPSHFAPPIQDFVIFAFNDSKVANAPTYQTQGTWTTGPTTGSGKTKFTDAEADDNGGGFASWMLGCLLVPEYLYEQAHLELKLARDHAGPPFAWEVGDGVERRGWVVGWEGGA